MCVGGVPWLILLVVYVIVVEVDVVVEVVSRSRFPWCRRKVVNKVVGIVCCVVVVFAHDVLYDTLVVVVVKEVIL